MSTQKSTIVRTAVRRFAVGTGFRVLDAAAPPVAGRLASRLWFTVPPPSRRAVTAPRTPGTPFTVALHGRTVRGRRFGDADGPTAVLVHGWGGTRAQLESFVDPLTVHGWQVVSYDGLSHGASDPGELGPSQSSAVELAAALRAVVDHVGPVAAVVAHSLGALAVAEALRSGLDTEQLVLIAPLDDASRAVSGFVAALGGGQRTERALVREVEARVQRSLADFTLVPTPAPDVPLLVVADTADRETPLAGAERVVAAWPGARLHRTCGLGHRRILTDPAVIELVATFLVDGPLAPGDQPADRVSVRAG